jgi:kynureninase
MSHPLAHWRAEYPILERTTYLVSHSLGAVPRATAANLARYYETWATQGILAWDGPWWQIVLDFCTGIEQLLGAPPQTVAPFDNATRGMAAVASCFSFAPPRNRVVMSNLEFTSSYPFWRGCERLGAELVIVASPDGATVPLEHYAAAIDERTLIVVASHVIFRSGALTDLGALAAIAHACGAYVLGDGYQAVGSVPIDLPASAVDFYVGGCHKYLSGGAGAGFLYVRQDLIARLEPWLSGWFGLADPFAYTHDTLGGARHPGIFRFLGGTPNIPGLYAASAGLSNVLAAGPLAIRAVSLALTDLLLDGARKRGLRIRTPQAADARGGMVCLDIAAAQPTCERLCAAGVLVDQRPDCGLRVSPHFYTLPDDLVHFWQTFDAVR